MLTVKTKEEFESWFDERWEELELERFIDVVDRHLASSLGFTAYNENICKKHINQEWIENHNRLTAELKRSLANVLKAVHDTVPMGLTNAELLHWMDNGVSSRDIAVGNSVRESDFMPYHFSCTHEKDRRAMIYYVSKPTSVDLEAVKLMARTYGENVLTTYNPIDPTLKFLDYSTYFELYQLRRIFQASFLHLDKILKGFCYTVNFLENSGE